MYGGDFLANKTLTTSGWGITLNETQDVTRSSQGVTMTPGRRKMVEKLRLVKVPGITNADCEKLYNADPIKNVTILAVEICAGDTDAGGIDSCMGDSGGNI